MRKLNCAVVGVGYLGRFHAQKYKLLPDVNLVGVCDVNATVAQTVAAELSVEAFTNYVDLLDKVDAVSIAATTNQHYAIAKEFLQHGIHVLIEKPITETIEQADELIGIAKKSGAKLQVGHLERFNSAHRALEGHLDTPLFIESQRLAPYNPRGTDVNVVLDLMIHDIDLIQSIVGSPIEHVDAHGAPVLSKSIDIANARITFANRCVANVTASRVSFKTVRKTRIFQKNSYLSIDYHNKQLAVFKKGEGELFPGIPDIIRQESIFDKSDALLEQIRSFCDCIRADKEPMVSGTEGRAALATAQAISTCIHSNLQEHYDFA